MCGLYGYFSTVGGDLPPKRLKSAIKALAIANQSRGTDSTGLAVIDRKQGLAMAHKTAEAQVFLKHAKIEQFLDEHIGKTTRAVIGHTRFATVGDVTLTNAMPFNVGHIVGAHNGTISNFRGLLQMHNFVAQTECDSEVIFHLMNNGLKLKKRVNWIKKLTGSYAVTFYDDRRPDRIYFARNTNPIKLGYSDIYKCYFWSSEEAGLDALDKKCYLKLKRKEIPTYTMSYLTEHGSFVSVDIPFGSWGGGGGYSPYGGYGGGGYQSKRGRYGYTGNDTGAYSPDEDWYDRTYGPRRGLEDLPVVIIPATSVTLLPNETLSEYWKRIEKMENKKALEEMANEDVPDDKGEMCDRLPLLPAPKGDDIAKELHDKAQSRKYRRPCNGGHPIEENWHNNC